MGTIAEKLAYLAETKDKIREAIVATGVEVPEGTTFRGFAELITGGGGTSSGKKVTSLSLIGDAYCISYEDGSVLWGMGEFDTNGLPVMLTDENGGSVAFTDGFPDSATDNNGYTVTISRG